MSPGAKIGPYEILTELGRGGMAIVFRAHDPAIRRTVAIKLIRWDAHAMADETERLRDRFAREAAAAGGLSHPNIVTIHQLGEHEGAPYMVMELVSGATLSRHRSISPDQAIAMLRQAAAALDYAHSQGIIHRDVKPSNIMVRADGFVKLTDFGIAHITSQTITGTGTTLGTPAYMAPEQISTGQVDARSDQFSLAIVAFELLSGRLPFEAPNDRTLMFKIATETAPLLDSVRSGYPPRVSHVIAKALSRDAARRYPSCTSFIEDLSRAFAETPPIELHGTADRTLTIPVPKPLVRLESAPVPLPQIFEPISEPRSKYWVWVVAGALIAISGGSYFALHQHDATGGGAIPASPVSASLPSGGNAAVPSPPKQKSAVAPSSPDETAPPKSPLKTKVNLKDQLTYVSIPAGTFRMGCSPRDAECYDDEKPSHNVTIPKPFWIGQSTVTQAAYLKVTGKDPSVLKGANLPVEEVSWTEAQAYCTDIGGRLPTEEEWEYAARAGSTGVRYGPIAEIAWYDGNSESKTHDVGQKAANAFGLYDMLGNVWQWTADWWTDVYRPGRQATQPPEGTPLRTIRGGSWVDSARFVRVSNRGRSEPGKGTGMIGFRCVE